MQQTFEGLARQQTLFGEDIEPLESGEGYDSEATQEQNQDQRISVGIGQRTLFAIESQLF